MASNYGCVRVVVHKKNVFRANIGIIRKTVALPIKIDVAGDAGDDRHIIIIMQPLCFFSGCYPSLGDLLCLSNW